MNEYLFLQVVVIAVMQQETEDVPSINHGIDATFLQLLSQPGLHWAQSMKQRHVRNRHGAWIELEELSDGKPSTTTVQTGA